MAVGCSGRGHCGPRSRGPHANKRRRNARVQATVRIQLVATRDRITSSSSPIAWSLSWAGTASSEGGDPGDRDHPGGEQDAGARADECEPRQQGGLAEHQRGHDPRHRPGVPGVPADEAIRRDLGERRVRINWTSQIRTTSPKDARRFASTGVIARRPTAASGDRADRRHRSSPEGHRAGSADLAGCVLGRGCPDAYASFRRKLTSEHLGRAGDSAPPLQAMSSAQHQEDAWRTLDPDADGSAAPSVVLRNLGGVDAATSKPTVDGATATRKTPRIGYGCHSSVS